MDPQVCALPTVYLIGGLQGNVYYNPSPHIAKKIGSRSYHHFHCFCQCNMKKSSKFATSGNQITKLFISDFKKQ